MWRCGCDHGKEVSGWRGEACIAGMCRGSLEFVDFYMPFSGKLNPDNRWVKLARLVPWAVENVFTYVLSLSGVCGELFVGGGSFGCQSGCEVFLHPCLHRFYRYGGEARANFVGRPVS